MRSSRRILRSRSTGVTGVSSDSDKEQRDSLTLASNKTGTTEADSQLDYNMEADEKDQRRSHSSDSNPDMKQETKSNGSIIEKPPSGKRRTRSGGQRIHPVITLQLTESSGTMRLDDGGLDNETFDGKAELRQDFIRSGHRTPPIHDVEMCGSRSSMRRASDDDNYLAAELNSRKQVKQPSGRTIKGSKEQNGTLLRSVIPESKTETNGVEETAVDLNNIDYDKVTYR